MGLIIHLSYCLYRINSQHNEIRRFVPSEADPNQPKKKMTAESLQAMIKIAKMEQGSFKSQIKLKLENY